MGRLREYPSEVRIVSYETEVVSYRFRYPLKFGKVVVEKSPSLLVKIEVENRKGEVGDGVGAMPLLTKWAFPDPDVDEEKKLEVMIKIGEETCKVLKEKYSWKYGHPIDIMMPLHDKILALGNKVSREIGLPKFMPKLGVLVASSPVDAALHDAFGRVNGISSYEGYGPKHMRHDLSFYLGERFRGKYISDYLRGDFVRRLPIFHLVGALDKIYREEVDAEDPRDGLPVALEDWIERDGVFCLKVKLRGNDLKWDVERTSLVAEVAQEKLKELGREEFYLSIDSNEMNPNPEFTLEYLRRLKKRSPLAFERLLYLEQPTERDLERHRFRLDKVSSVKMVLADEGVVDLNTLKLALQLGWSGVAVKTCKWHTSSLLYIAYMEENGIPYSIQDLTCPGLSLVHEAGLAARTKPIKGFEYNARQYLPHAFPEVQERHRSLFKVKDGYVETDTLLNLGLGYDVRDVSI